MKPRACGLAQAMVLFCASAVADTAYVTDELVLNVYSDENSQGQRLATLHSGASVDVLSNHGEFTQVRLGDGTTGWVKSSFLTGKEPASFRVKQLEDELERTRATTPALAEAAERSEVERLSRVLTLKQGQLDAQRAPVGAAAALNPLLVVLLCVALLLLGFWSGYATLARRVKRKFGGIRVY